MKKFIQRLWRGLCADFLRKISALALAIMLYYAISEQLRETRIIHDVPIAIQAESGLLGAPMRAMVNVTVAGPSRMFKRADFTGEDFIGSITIREKDRMPDGRYRVAISPRIFRERDGVRVVHVDKEAFFFDLQHEISTLVKVKVQTDGAPAGNYEVASCRCVPDQVRITGPEISVNALKEVKTEAIPLTDSISESFERKDVKIGSMPPEITVEPKSVTVFCEIVARNIEGVIPRVPVQIKNSDPFFQIGIDKKDAAVSVKLFGPPSRVADLQAHPEEIGVYPDISGIDKEGDYEVPLLCTIPQSDVTFSIVPDKIRIHVTTGKRKNLF